MYIIKKIDITNKKQVKLFCRDVVKYLSNFKGYEESFIVCRGGNIKYFSGEKYFVSVPDSVSKSAIIDIHNHPHDCCRSFSREDINSWRKGVLYYVVDKQYVYRAFVKKNIPYDPYILVKLYDMKKYASAIKEDDQHALCLYLMDKGYIDYEKMGRYSWLQKNS